MSARDLDAFLADVAADLAVDVAEEQDRLTPDFAAVVEEARARGQSPGEVDLAALDPGADANVGPHAVDADLDALLGDARRAIDADRAARALLAIPPVPLPAPRRRGAWLGALLAIAAAVLVVVGLRPLLGERRGAAHGPHTQAEWRDRPGEGSVRAAEPASPPAPAPAPARHVPSDMSEGDAASTTAAPADAPAEAHDAFDAKPPPADTPAAAPASEAAPAAPASRPRPAVDPIAALEADAEARWREGDLAGASERLREVIRRAKSPRRIDLAYGDLFTITRQLEGRDAEAALWVEYLARLPRGRYADDARAGLCRRADDPAACWRRYLDEFPRGAHRDEAERAAAP